MKKVKKMSEEKRFIKNKKILALSISLVAVCVLAGVFGISYFIIVNNYGKLSDKYTVLTGDFEDLTGDYESLLDSFNELDNQYFILTGEHIELENDYDDLLNAYNALLDTYNNLSDTYENLLSDYNILLGDYNTLLELYDILYYDFYLTLLDDYNALSIAYDYICDTIRQSILPVQYCIFAEAVRRYYMPIYMENLTGKQFWMAYAEFCRDIILHDSWQYNSFNIVSNAFSDALIFGDDTMTLADYIMYWTFYPWLPNWYGWGLTGDELTDIDTIVDWCIDEIVYEYDAGITDGQEYFDWDYIKFPVETAFRTMGDCEDQAILTAAYLESCGFETTIGIWHDPEHPEFTGGLFHGVLFVQIVDVNAFWTLFPTTPLWRMSNEPIDEFTWCLIDTTWDVPFGSTPSWFDYYMANPYELTLDDFTRAVCDIDGTIEGNLGITYAIPT